MRFYTKAYTKDPQLFYAYFIPLCSDGNQLLGALAYGSADIFG
jgi:hypothetical protein